MKIAFLTEMGFEGKIPSNHPNMRTEFAWMFALDATHHNIHQYKNIKHYNHVFIIFPKGKTFLNAEGISLSNEPNPVSELLTSDIISVLKQNNDKVYYVQEGPHWWFNNYELPDQINFYNLLTNCDAIFAHNEYDVDYYKGLVPNKPVYSLPTLMIENNISHIVPKYEEKSIIGGNFARWYGGFESYIIAQEFNVPIWGQTSHASRNGENQMINILPRVFWTDWIQQLSSFKYAVHLMPTIAAGTFSLNCAYLGIPCIGNDKVDTQRLCHPDLSVDIADIYKARVLANKLATDKEFYNYCSNKAKENYKEFYKIDLFKQKLFNILSI